MVAGVIPRFALEDWFAAHRGCPINLGSSDVEPVLLETVLNDEAMRALSQLTLGYGGVLGRQHLREAIAATYSSVDAEEVHCFAGATEALLCATSALLEPGAHAVVITPAYQLLTGLPEIVGATTTAVPLRYTGESWSLDLQAVEDAITDATRVLIVNSPNNPTGWIAEPDCLAALHRAADRVGAVLLVDEVYRGLERHTPSVSVADLHPGTVAIGSLSKTHGTAGLRIGWAVTTDPEIRDRMRTARYWSSLSSSPVTDQIGVHVLHQSEQLLQRGRNYIAQNLRQLRHFVDQRSDVDFAEPAGGTTGYLHLKSARAQEIALELANRGVFTVPSSALLSDGEFLRLALARKAFASGIAKLGEVLDEHLPSAAHAH